MKPYTPYIPLTEPPRPTEAPVCVGVEIDPDILKAVKHTFFTGELDGNWYQICLVEPSAPPIFKERPAGESRWFDVRRNVNGTESRTLVQPIGPDFEGLPW